MSQLKSCLILCLLCLQTSLFAQLQNFEIKKKEVSNPKLDSLCKCYMMFSADTQRQARTGEIYTRTEESLEEIIKKDSVRYYMHLLRGRTPEKYAMDYAKEVERTKGFKAAKQIWKQIRNKEFKLPEFVPDTAKYAKEIASERAGWESIYRDSRKLLKENMEELRRLPYNQWVYVFDTLQLGGNNPTLYPGEYVSISRYNDIRLLMNHDEDFYLAKQDTRILTMPVKDYDFWFRRLKGGTKIIIPSYKQIKNLVTDEYVSLDSLTEADLIIARENKNGVESINEYAKVSEDMIFKINSGIMYDWIDVSGSLDKVRPNASLLSDSTLYAVASQLMMQWRHFKEEGSSGSKDLIYKLITKEDYDRIKQLEKDFPQIEAEHKEAVDKGFKEWVSVSTKAYAAAYTALMGKDPQIGLSVKELKNYVILSKVPQGTTTYYKIKHLLNEKIYEITVDSKGVITAYNLIVY